MNTKKILTSTLIYLAVLFAVFSFSFWRLRALAEGYSMGEWFPQQEYTERDPTKPAKPFFSLLTNRSYGTNERPRLWLNYRDVDAIDFRVYRLNDPAKFFHQLDNPHQFGEDEQNEFESYFRKRKPTFLEKVREFKRAFYSWARDYFRSQLKNSSRRGFNEKFRNPDEELESQRSPLNVADYARVPLINPDQLVTSWREKLPPLENEYDRRPIPIGKREAGVYVVEAVNGDLRAYGIVMITDLTMVEKTSKDGGLMIYAVNRQSGAPRAGVKLDIYQGKDTLTSGTTDNQGLYRTVIKPKKQPNANADEGGGDEEGGDEEGGGDESQASYVVMANDAGNFAISDLESYYFGGGGEYDEEGGDSGDLTSFVYTDRPVYRTNQKVYFKGILRKRTDKGYLLPKGAVTVSVTDPNDSKVFEQEMTLSSRGTFSGEVNLDEDAPLGTYSVVAESEDGTARGSFEVMEYKKPEYKVTVSVPQKFVQTGTNTKFTISARYFFGSPVTKADVKYTIYRSRYYPDFFRDNETDPLADFGVDDNNTDESGGYYGDEGDSMVKEGEGKLDSNGQLQVDFQIPDAGEKQTWDYTYRLDAEVTDAARREMSGSAEMTGIRGTTVATADTERYVYYQGETAKILVHTRDYEGHPKSANVTLKFVEDTWEKIEKNDYGYTYYDYKLHENDLSSTTVQTNDQGEASLDYKIDHPGDIQIKTVVNENGKQITMVGGSVWIADTSGEWGDYSYQNEDQIKLVPDKKTYRVGETAHVLALLPKEKAHLLVTTELSSVLSVREVDTAGRAVVIDVPVDSKFAPNLFLNVTYVRNGEMYTSEESIVVPPRDKLLNLEIIPNKSEYKPRETVSYTVVARNGDGSPAANAEVSLGVVDEAIYSISPDNAGDIRREFYGRRYNEVNTSYSTNYTFTGYAGKEQIKLAQNKRAYQLADFKNDTNNLVEPVVRKLFKDTAYWQPAVVTGADGKATVNVQLPDNLTTWRATARAVTADTRVGVTTSKVVERKDVILRLAMPRFLTAGDTVVLSGIVHNYLPADKTTQISINVNGAQLLDPATQTVSIPHNGEYRVNWRVNAPQTGDVTLLAKALTDTDSDAVELPMPVVPRGLKQTYGQSVTLAGDTDDDKTFTINLPSNADLHYRKLRVEAAPSVASTLFGALDYLTSYPYGCTEQTMSSFLPTVIVANTLHDVSQASISDKNNIGRKVSKGLKRLYGFQHEDGGWGWWKDDQTDAFMTAYVVDGLFLASKAGYEVDDQRMMKAREKLGGLIINGKDDEGKDIDMETRAFMIYSYSETGGVDAQYVNDLYNNRGRLQPYGRALLALTLKQRGDGRARQVASEIEGSAAQTDFDAHWESKRKPMLDFTEENNIEATALSVKALALVAPQSGVLPKAARWLVSNRRNGYYWQSTKQTAFAIYGLTDYLKVSNELTPDYALEVYVNGEQVLTQQVTAADAKSAKSFVVTRKDQQVGNQTQVRVVKHGAGVVYLSAALDFATTEEATAPQSTSGIKITREYLRLTLDDSGDQLKWKTEPLSGELHSGDTIVSRITIEGNAAQYMMIEDPIPAGCEQADEVGGLNLDYNMEGWTHWYSNREFRDDRTVFFLNYFSGAKETFQTALRVQEPGEFRVAPARVELMYQPSVQSNTASGKLTILDRK